MTRPIVSSAHLISDKSPELSEFEYGLIIASNAFSRWATRCATAAGLEGLAYLDILVLHSINHRARPKKLADLCFVLNIEDTHTVTYACKKLVRLGLVKREKQGKELLFSITDKGGKACGEYARVREDCLVETLAGMGPDNKEIGDLAATLRALSGLYDQAARAAASL